VKKGMGEGGYESPERGEGFAIQVVSGAEHEKRGGNTSNEVTLEKKSVTIQV